MERKYYEAYEDRYLQIHRQDLQWFSENASPIVSQTLQTFSIAPPSRLLEIGCGEGRDAYPVLRQGYDLLATDISPEAIGFCRRKFPDFSEHFQTLDCIAGTLDGWFDFIYAVAVLHMLLSDEDRDGFYRFIREHLSAGGIGLICTMGDGEKELRTDAAVAFDLQDRVHEETGRAVKIAATSCRMVSFPAFERELRRNRLAVLQKGIAAVEPDFPQMMFAVVKSA